MADVPESVQGESVDRVRDILFGPKMRDFEQRFEVLSRDMSRLQGDLDQLSEQLTATDAGQGKALQGLRQELRQASGDLRSEYKGEVARLGTQLAEQVAAQSTNLQALRQELRQADSDLQTQIHADLEQLGTQTAEQNASLQSSLQGLRQELRKADAGLREELRQLTQRLTDDKADRSTMGDLFIELGNHVKTGGSFADLLKVLDQPG